MESTANWGVAGAANRLLVKFKSVYVWNPRPLTWLKNVTGLNVGFVSVNVCADPGVVKIALNVTDSVIALTDPAVTEKPGQLAIAIRSPSVPSTNGVGLHASIRSALIVHPNCVTTIPSVVSGALPRSPPTRAASDTRWKVLALSVRRPGQMPGSPSRRIQVRFLVRLLYRYRYRCN